MDDKTIGVLAVTIFTKIIPGLLGSLSSIFFGNGNMSKKQKVASVIIPILFVYYVGPFIVTRANMTTDGGPEALGFLLGMFGMAILREAFKDIPVAFRVAIGFFGRFIPGGK